jgi:hypothetical protein
MALRMSVPLEPVTFEIEVTAAERSGAQDGFGISPAALKNVRRYREQLEQEDAELGAAVDRFALVIGLELLGVYGTFTDAYVAGLTVPFHGALLDT